MFVAGLYHTVLVDMVVVKECRKLLEVTITVVSFD